MPVHNAEVAEKFDEIADLLEIKGANEYRVRAYRNAARTVESMSRRLHEMVEEGEDLSELADVGGDLAEKIEQIIRTGECPIPNELKDELPEGLLDMLRVEGLGPKRVQQLYEELDIHTLDQLEDAAEQGDVRELKGLGEKIEQNILDHLEAAQTEERRFLWSVADEVVPSLVDYLEEADGVKNVVVAGSYRRRKETVGDLDILVTGSGGEDLSDHFVDYEDVEDVVSQGDTKSTVILRNGLQVDLRIVPQESYGAAMHYFTGSKAHNIALRNIAVEDELKLNEYGLFEGDEKIAGETEEGIYDYFGLPYIEPELREDRGELDAARAGNLPDLVSEDDLKGDLQTHTTDSDGNDGLEAMVEAARDLGHDYVAVTDHSAHVGITQGLDAGSLREQNEQIDQLNQEYNDIEILKGIEVDIMENGELGLDDEVLAEQDVVLAAVHTKFNLSEQNQTERVCRALEHPRVNIYVHPTCRKINEREPIALDLDEVMDTALDNDCYLEINAQPKRLDLNDHHARMAKKKGLKLTVSTDAHSTDQLTVQPHGIGQARRGWLEKEDVLNTRSLKELRDYLK